jgi:hypothetical protein
MPTETFADVLHQLIDGGVEDPAAAHAVIDVASGLATPEPETPEEPEPGTEPEPESPQTPPEAPETASKAKV